MTKIKICGLRRPCDIDYVNALRPDYIGFVFAKDRKRYIDPRQALELRKRLAPGILPVGVFVDEPLEEMKRILSLGVMDMIQLHGHEDAAYMETLRQWTKLPLIKAFHLKTEEDQRIAFLSGADYILLDHGIGGTGETFDWTLLGEGGAKMRPYFLAGGLDASNVADAVRRLSPYAVDVSSGVETDGFKDPDKMKKFVEAVRAAG